ncbi:hypothetical protein Moror_12227 [Moniliophthora roreri MCA 2997]|uniref:Uncharacterized protein n=1 Tax=Moniliophthora roreri (strain MCA 2997) TaxID=1381753 RepID=V2WMQ5_MONRO|nr:hypothetical protein Moror_12227 [Moniliophthora roreri MCA 2997]
MDPNEHRMTFMEVFRGLFNGFIDVEYRAGGGVEKLFADLRDYAEIMPIPPDRNPVNDIIQRVLEQERGTKRNTFYARGEEKAPLCRGALRTPSPHLVD